MSAKLPMNTFVFQRHDREFDSDAWRPLDRVLLRWVLAHGGSELLARTAAWASLADGNGDTALPIGDWPEAEIAALRAEPMVSRDDTGAPTPFVLDDDGRFYLWRNRRDESVVMERVRRRRQVRAPAAIIDADIANATVVEARAVEAGLVDADLLQTNLVETNLVETDLDALFGSRGDDAIAAQRAAVAQVAGRRLFVLTGGPGTGKTTTVLRMLLMLQRIAGAPLAIQLAAPTGKAAQRLVESLRHGKHALLHDATTALSPDWHALLDRVPDREALTLHRLLGYQPWNNRFGRNARNPVAADVVVVDEASMVDLAMLRSLLDALRPDATLILVGDADQLASIAAGSALMDLVSVMEGDQAGDIVRLRHSFRAESSLVAINEAVRRGDAVAFEDAWRTASDRAIRRNANESRQLAGHVRAWADRLAQDVSPVVDGDRTFQVETVRRALRALSTRQLLCALRESDFGSLAVDAAIDARLRLAWNVPDAARWYAGRAIIVTRNDYASRLFNGDVGLCLADADGRLRVWFPDMGENGEPDVRSFDPHALPAHEGAFAITIHKSQGSEYDRVAVLLPPHAEHRILSRQLLYTGLSRARQAVELWSTDSSLEAALAQPVRRAGGLATRLGGRIETDW